jgi:hypothetical protein
MTTLLLGNDAKACMHCIPWRQYSKEKMENASVTSEEKKNAMHCRT